MNEPGHSDDHVRRERRHYRKIYTRIWSHPAFRALTDSEKVVALYLLSGPQTNRVGLYKLSIGAATDDLLSRKDRFLAKVATCFDKFGWVLDKTSSVLWIPSWWEWNPPGDKVNNFKGALTDLNDVPPTYLISCFCNNLDALSPVLHPLVKAWEKAHPSSNTVQNTVTNTVQNSESHTVRTRARAKREREREREIKDRTTPPDGDVFHLPVEISELHDDETVQQVASVVEDREPRAQSLEPELHHEPEPPPEPLGVPIDYTDRPMNGQTRRALAREPAPDLNYRALRKAALEELSAGDVESEGDLEDRVKRRCASRGIAYGPHEVGDALARACAAAWSAHKIGVTQ